MGNPAEADAAAPRSRTAIIAVHGVADQKPGATAQALAELLIAQAPPGVAYHSTSQTDLILPVAPLAPIAPSDPTPAGVLKLARQSVRPDFVRRLRAAPHGDVHPDAAGMSRGARFTDYLLNKAQQGRMGTETFAARRIAMERRGPDGVEGCDVLELHWADLSRLDGNAPAIVTELFTLLFRLSTLGRDTVQTAATCFRQSRAWRILEPLQTALDWGYSRLLALLFLQLVMIALTLVAMGLACEATAAVHKAVSVLAGVGTGLRVMYRYRRPLLGMGAGVIVGVALWIGPAPWAIGLVWFLCLGRVYDAYLRMCEERFRFVRCLGWSLWLIVIAITVGFGIQFALVSTQPVADLEPWIFGSLRAVEVTLTAIGWWWIAAGFVLLAWLIAGSAARRATSTRCETKPSSGDLGFYAKASVATGRFALSLSLVFFFIIAMSAWALVNRGIAHAVTRFDYQPLIFTHASMEFAQTAPLAVSATRFLEDRFNNHAEAFSVSFVLLLLLMAYLLVVLLPCVLAELRWKDQEPARLGRWLTSGYRYLETTVIGGLVALAVIAATAVSGLLFWLNLADAPPADWIVAAERAIAAQSRWLLEPLVLSTGAATVALTAAGRLLSRYVPWLRAPLDIALDVDNHFREFPRRAIPRARVFARYAALLQYVASMRYDRIVIVSHSQGTVISTEMLRYLKERAAACAAAPDPLSALWRALEGRLRLLTAGSPLRQLYAARFPVMYDWVLAEHAGRMGPTCADVGVERWINVYGAGDYIGRWLWSRPPTGQDTDEVLPLIDAGAPEGHPYAVDDRSAAMLAEHLRHEAAFDVNLGADAHTHYFDPDRATVAWLVDALLAHATFCSLRPKETP